MDRRLAGFAGGSDLDVWDARAVLGDHLVTSYDELGRIEGLRRALQELRCGERLDEIKRWRGQRVLRTGEQVAGRLLCANIERPDIGDA